MTETTELNTETGTCIGCRLPWNGESGTGCCRNAVLVIADDAGIEVAEILLPANKDKQKNPAEQEIPAGQLAGVVQKTPLEHSTPGRKIISAELEISAEQSNREKQVVAEEPDIPVEQSTPERQITPVEQSTPSRPEIIIGVRI